MGVEVVFDKDDFLRVRENALAQKLKSMGVIDTGASSTFGYEDLAQPYQRCIDHKRGGRPFPNIFTIVLSRAARLSWTRGAHFTEQLFTEFIETDQRAFGIVWAVVNAQDVFHARDEVGTLLWRNAPALLPPGLDEVFFKL